MKVIYNFYEKCQFNIIKQNMQILKVLLQKLKTKRMAQNRPMAIFFYDRKFKEKTVMFA